MFVSRGRIDSRGSTAWVNLRFANSRRTMEEITTGDMEYSKIKVEYKSVAHASAMM